MSNEHELELLHRREEILRQTKELTSDVVQSLGQQQQFTLQTKEDLHQQNVLLSLANAKMRSMNEDLTSVVNEMNEINTQQACFCCRKKRKKSKQTRNSSKPVVFPTLDRDEKVIQTTSIIPELVENNVEEKLIVNELNQMRSQLLVFQDQVRVINKSFDEGDEIIDQLGNETDQYMHAINRAINKAEEVLGQRFVVNEEQPQLINSGRERRPGELEITNKPV